MNEGCSRGRPGRLLHPSDPCCRLLRSGTEQCRASEPAAGAGTACSWDPRPGQPGLLRWGSGCAAAQRPPACKQCRAELRQAVISGCEVQGRKRDTSSCECCRKWSSVLSRFEEVQNLHTERYHSRTSSITSLKLTGQWSGISVSSICNGPGAKFITPGTPKGCHKSCSLNPVPVYEN